MDETFVVRRGKRLKFLFVLSVLAILFATLWPFNPWPRNKATWLPDGHGIAFAKPGLVVSATPLPTQSTEGASRTLELLIRPNSTESFYIIATFYRPNDPAQLHVAQWANFLLLAHNVLDDNGHPVEQKFDIVRPFRPGDLMLLTLVFTPQSTSAYVDGRFVATSTKFVISPQELAGQIVVGASAVNYALWPGEIHGMAIYSKELTATEIGQHYGAWANGDRSGPPDLDYAIAYYAFNEGAGRVIRSAVHSAPDLEIPQTFAVLHKPMLKSVRKEFIASWKYVNDVLRNIVGFIPVGFVFCAYFLQARNRGAAILLATLAGAALSLTVEILQTYVPQRGSGFTDVITNTLGTAIGAALSRPVLIQAILLRGIAPSPKGSN
jgi:VanZ like family/Concanavalin A-like lectin/glucanases superfamily